MRPNFGPDPLAQDAARRFQVVGGLKANPEVGAGVEQAGETQGGFGRHRTPAMNNLPMDTSATTPYTTKAMLGGIMMPMAPALAISAEEKPLS